MTRKSKFALLVFTLLLVIISFSAMNYSSIDTSEQGHQGKITSMGNCPGINGSCGQ